MNIKNGQVFSKTGIFYKNIKKQLEKSASWLEYWRNASSPKYTIQIQFAFILNTYIWQNIEI